MTSPPRMAFYADDLTGATDVLEACVLSGWTCRVFLNELSPDAASSGHDAVGLAGVSRSKSPGWMDDQLPPLFSRLSDTGAPVLFYKVCSTFDSSPQVGSIGKVLEIGAAMFGTPVPIVVGVPRNGRYTAFGELFATDGLGQVHRIDRHPVMSVHPSTPMDEANLIRHLQRQTASTLACIDFRQLGKGGTSLAIAQRGEAGIRGVLLDNLDESTEAEIRLAFAELCRPSRQVFVIGSSGAVYALAGGRTPDDSITAPGRAVDRLLILSGSASATTARQIAAASKAGYAVHDLDFCCDAPRLEEADTALAAAAAADMAERQGVVICTGSRRLDAAAPAVAPGRTASPLDPEIVGRRLGRIASQVLGHVPGLSRIVIAGGDTSGFAAREMGIEALDFAAPALRGSPLCKVHSNRERIHGLEIVLKGGQVGAAMAFEDIRLGNNWVGTRSEAFVPQHGRMQ